MGTTTLLSFEEFERLPDEAGKMELRDGEPIRLPRVKKRHTRASHRFRDVLMPLVDRAAAAAGLGDVYVKMGYKIGPRNWLQPDVGIEHANQFGGGYSEAAPALAVEVISASNTAEQVEYKRQTYLANGATEVWVGYPKTRSGWIFRRGHAQEFREILTSDLIPGLRIDLGGCSPSAS